MAASASVVADPSYPPLLPSATVPPPPLLGAEALEVPVIDLGNLEHKRLGDACRTLGLFRLVNHGLQPELSLRLRAEAQRIFELPFDRKRAEMSGPDRGRPATYFWGTPAVSLRLRSFNWLEGLQVPLSVLRDGDCGGRSVDNVGSDSIRTLIEEYGDHMIRIVRTLFVSLAAHLKLNPSLSESHMDTSNGIFRAYRYPRSPESQSLMGMAAHTDSSVLTVVDQDDAGGLQIRHENTWFEITPVAGTLIVNVGDMLQAISNGEFRSAEHRVLASGTKERISLCFFAFPKEDFKIRSMGYREFTYGEFKAQVGEDIKETGDKTNLVGGYYDSGDNVKFGFPLAFTITTLSWGVVEFRNHLAAASELDNALAAVRWGTDYFLKAHTAADELYVEVGDGSSDHSCWQRPEDMTTPRTSYKVDTSHPGSDIAGETAAALAAASIAFQPSDSAYAADLLSHAKQLFEFAKNHPGLYQNSVPVAGQFYSSSGFDDEVLWAAAWIHLATGDQTYLEVIGSLNNNGGVRSMFSWDDKFVGAQVLITKLILENKLANNGAWNQYKDDAEQFICSVLQKGSNNVKLSPGGMLWFQPWNNFQYTTAAMLVLSAHADHLAAAKASLHCPSGVVSPADIIVFVARQVDYLLGNNPKKMSYMVGFSSNWPAMVHHRGASIVSIRKDSTPVDCKGGFTKWFNSPNPNPNVIGGAIVGGPDANDGYSDDRSNYQQAEPSTVTTAAIVGVLARLT